MGVSFQTTAKAPFCAPRGETVSAKRASSGPAVSGCQWRQADDGLVAFSNIYRAELACKAQVLVMSCGSEIVMPRARGMERSNDLYRPEVRRPFGVLEWPALLRKLDRIDPSYRD